MKQQIKDLFIKNYGDGARLFCSPGRVNLIGEHTDYNMGFVLPGAIDKAIYVAIKPNGLKHCRITSLDYNQTIELDLNGPKPTEQWACYIYGVVQEMKKREAVIEPFDMVFGGDVPLGAGLSSSAALESSVGFALNTIYKLGFSLKDLAIIGQMTEHNYVGVRCGIMDQFVSLMAEQGKVIKLDCRTLDFEQIPFDPVGYRLVLIDTKVKHTLASSEYNVRREQCEKGVSIIAKHAPDVKSLRDVTVGMLEEYKDQMEDIVYRRCSFVINENQRLLDACQALQQGDYRTFGQKMNGSHEGLSKWYEVSCPELDFLADLAHNHSGVVGARMMGGGFGGCTINLVEQGSYETFLAQAQEKFNQKFGQKPRVIEFNMSRGAHEIL